MRNISQIICCVKYIIASRMGGSGVWWRFLATAESVRTGGWEFAYIYAAVGSNLRGSARHSVRAIGMKPKNVPASRNVATISMPSIFPS